MKRMLVPAALSLATLAVTTLAIATGAFPQGVTQSVMLRAVVPKFCTIGGSLAPVEFEITLRVSGTGTISTSVPSFTVPSAICNTPADIIASSRLGKARATGHVRVLSGFTDSADYIATTKFGGAVAMLDTTVERGRTATTQGAVNGVLTITVIPVQPAVPLVPATVYTDTLRVRLVPR